MMVKEIFGPMGHDNYREYSKDIHASGTHLLNLLSDILDISKIEAGALELFEEDLDVSEVMASAVRMVRDQSDKREIKVSIDLEDNVQRLRGDELRLKQVLLNLLSNAIKFTPPEGRITVKANVNGENAMVWQVADTGIGIGAEDLTRLMKPFEQVRECSTQTHEGTGLGLYLTKTLAEMHGGNLMIESEIGKGTIVTVWFPPERTI